MKKSMQDTTLYEKEVDKNKNSTDDKSKTTNINILLNRVRADKEKGFKKKITLIFFLILTLSVVGVIILT